MASFKIKDRISSSDSKGINTIIGQGAVVEGPLTVPHDIRVTVTYRAIPHRQGC